MRRRCAYAALAGIAIGGAWASGLGPCRADAPPSAMARVEARSADILAVGVAQGDILRIHLSRVLDNAPIQDAVLTVVLRGTAHAATAETDGGYSLETADLKLPGAAAVEFQIRSAALSENLRGTLDIAAAGASENKNSARQLGWWVLNFAVCFGVLWLISRRRKAAKA